MKHEATYRSVQDSYWLDMTVIDWSPFKKLLYLWLFTNPHLDICGCYQISTRVMTHETGIDHSIVLELLTELENEGKLIYDQDSKEMLMLNWKKHNQGFFKTTNRNSLKSIKVGAKKIKSERLRQIVMSWIGESETPTLAPCIQPEPKPEPEPTDISLDDATEVVSDTPLPPTPRKKSSSSKTKKPVEQETAKRIRLAFEERKAFLEERFPWLDLAVEAEQCVAKYRDKPVGTDAAVLVLEWCKRSHKPSGDPDKRGSPPAADGGVRAKQAVSFDAIDRVVGRIREVTGDDQCCV